MMVGTSEMRQVPTCYGIAFGHAGASRDGDVGAPADFFDLGNPLLGTADRRVFLQFVSSSLATHREASPQLIARVSTMQNGDLVVMTCGGSKPVS